MSIETEHNGAKNGGGFHGRRVEAKSRSDIERRANDKTAVLSGVADYQPRQPVAQFIDDYGDVQLIHRPKGRRLSVFKAMNTPALRLNRAIAALLGERIRDRRLELGLSMKEVGIRAGLSSASPKQYIHAIESAGNPNRRTEGVRLGTLFALAYALECSPTDLLPPPAEVMALANVSPEEFKALAA